MYQRLGKETGRLRNLRTSRGLPDYGIIKIGQNTEKSPGDLRRPAIIQTPVKDHQLVLVWKTRIIIIIIIIIFIIHIALHRKIT